MASHEARTNRVRSFRSEDCAALMGCEKSAPEKGFELYDANATGDGSREGARWTCTSIQVNYNVSAWLENALAFQEEHAEDDEAMIQDLVTMETGPRSEVTIGADDARAEVDFARFQSQIIATRTAGAATAPDCWPKPPGLPTPIDACPPVSLEIPSDESDLTDLEDDQEERAPEDRAEERSMRGKSISLAVPSDESDLTDLEHGLNATVLGAPAAASGASRRKSKKRRHQKQRAQAKAAENYRVNQQLSERWRDCEVVEHSINKEDLPVAESEYVGSKQKKHTQTRRVLPLLRSLLEGGYTVILWDGR